MFKTKPIDISVQLMFGSATDLFLNQEQRSKASLQQTNSLLIRLELINKKLFSKIHHLESLKISLSC